MRLPAGPLLALLLTLATVTLAADPVLLGSRQERNSTHGLVTVLDDRIVQSHAQRTAAGDLVWALAAPGPFGAPLASTDFYIVPDGGAAAAHTGAAPASPLLASTGIPATACCDGKPVHFTRPPGAGASDRVELVWVHHFAPGEHRPTDPEARRYFDAWATLAASGHGDSPVVIPASALRLHGILLAAAAALLAGAAACAALWARRLLAPRPPAGPREAAVGLAEAGGAHLRRLRAVWLGLGVPLAIGILLLVNGIAEAQGYVADPAPGWTGATTLLFAGLCLVALAAWAAAVAGTHLALRRWRAGMAASPLA
jgi:hypothetical protein